MKKWRTFARGIKAKKAQNGRKSGLGVFPITGYYWVTNKQARMVVHRRGLSVI